MTGLEKIIEQISIDSEQICKDKLEKAQETADKITAEASEKARQIAAEDENKIISQCDNILSHAHSAADLEKRRTILSSKQEIISEMLENSRKNILNIDDSKYFQLVFSMIKKNALKKNGKIAFNERDLKRMPDGFIEKVNAETGLDLELNAEPVNIDGGFILLYGGIEENCSFSAIFSGERERLSDVASKLLFDN